MKYVFNYWGKIQNFIKGYNRIFLFFDYDGTLTPIVASPSEAKLAPSTKAILKDFTKCKYFKIGIISGRALKQIKSLVGIKNIYYAGNHGLEICGPGLNFIHPKVHNFHFYLKKIKSLLKKDLSKIKGILLEDKRYSLSLHYRRADKKDIKRIKNIFKKNVKKFLRKKKVKITKGKKVLEIRPAVNWNKGDALKMIIKGFKTSPSGLIIYIGDDKTDNDAFRFLRKKGISISIGKEGSLAEYFLKSPQELKIFLKRLKTIKKEV